jgi:tetratricopeptide (TPR) repeat protein
MRNDRLMSLPGFLDAFTAQHRDRPDRPFCFILGAGASQQSDIPAGAAMAREWLETLHRQENFENLPLEQWATAERLGIPDFDLQDLARFYPELYARRFQERPEDGFAFLETKMEGKEPSFGYSVLAYILAETHHKILITTNFDNLAADALSIHSSTFPVVVSHDSLADYARVALRRPLIAKVHGSLGFAPKSCPEELQCLPGQWQSALTRILERYTPIVVGYNGNDGSLMGALELLPDGVPDTVFWCFRDAQDRPQESLARTPRRLHEFVARKRGRFIPIHGFDEMMLLLHRQLSQVGQVPNLYDRLKNRTEARLKRFDDQHCALNKKLEPSKPVKESIPTAVARSEDSLPIAEPKLTVARLLADALGGLAEQRKDKPWWKWEMEAAAHADADGREGVYHAALKALPKSAPLLGHYALFLNNRRKNYDLAEEYYLRALEADSTNANNLGNYALFLEKHRRNNDRAEEFYRRAIDADPKHAPSLGNFAVFLKDQRRDYDRAEEFHRRAIEADPKDANNLGNYAVFLESHRKDYDRAEEFYRRAITANPNDANSLGNFALFLQNQRKDYDHAEAFYRRAIESDPEHASNLGNYAVFLKNHRKDYARAEEFYLRAIEADPKHANNLGNYALFLENNRKDYNHADEFYRRALEVNPKHATSLGNYALFLEDQRKDYCRAEEFYRRAIEADPKHANNLCNYAVFLTNHRNDIDGAEEFFCRALEADPEHANNLGNFAEFLQYHRKDLDRAEECYRRAVASNPNQAFILGNLALFLTIQRNDLNGAEEFYRRAIKVDPKNARNLANYVRFLWKFVGRPDLAALRFAELERLDGLTPDALFTCAVFCHLHHRDHPRAEALYDRALAADGRHAASLGNSSQLLLARGEEKVARERLALLDSIQEVPEDVRLEAGFYRVAHFAESWPTGLKSVKEWVTRGVRSAGWDFSPDLRRAAASGHANLPLLEALARVITAGAVPAILDAFPEWQAA